MRGTNSSKIFNEVIYLTRQDVIEFLHDNYNCRKGDMKNIKDMISVGKKVGYIINKDGIDNYSMREIGVIVDFTKPLKIYRELPQLSKSKYYNGVPLTLFTDWNYIGIGFNPELWCYLMNKRDGDIIHFDEIIHSDTYRCNNYEDIIDNFDALSWFGYIREKDDCIEMYAYPQQYEDKFSWEYFDKKVKRMAPYKFEK